jgi:hypothetical protein
MGSCPAAQGVQAGLLPRAKLRSIGKASAQMVSRTDRQLAQSPVSKGTKKASVTRDDL